MLVKIGREILEFDRVYAVHAIQEGSPGIEALELYGSDGVTAEGSPVPVTIRRSPNDHKTNEAWLALNAIAADKFILCGNWLIRSSAICRVELGDASGFAPATLTLQIGDQPAFTVGIDRDASKSLAGQAHDLEQSQAPSNSGIEPGRYRSQVPSTP